MNNQTHQTCPRCGHGRLRQWNKLSDEQQELVLRLPASADYTLTERQATHRWCTNCWHEATQDTAREG